MTATVIKLKRSETPGLVPTTSTITAGEVAVNIADRVIYIRDSNNNIVQVANFSEGGTGTPTVDFNFFPFPTGDYGDLSALSQETAFGTPVDISFDANTTPSNALAIKDLGGLT
jgi:hypothetical protein